MAKLYELSEQYRKFNEYVEEQLSDDNEISDEESLQMYIDTLDAITDEISGKCENIVKFMKNIEGDIDAYKKEEQRLAKKRKYLENKYDGLKTYMSQMLVNAKISTVNAGMFKVKFQNSNPSVGILNEDSIPAKYKEKVPDKIKKADILIALKAKEVIPGAILVEDKQHLRIT